MSFLLLFIGSVLVVSAAYLLAQNPFFFFRQSYELGLRFWSQWLPLLSILAYGIFFGSALIGVLPSEFHLGYSLTFPQTSVFFGIGLLFLTRLNNLAAALILGYVLYQIVPAAPHSTLGMTLLLSCLTILTLLGDRLVFLADDRKESLMIRIREIAIVLASLLLSAIHLMSLLNVKQFATWIHSSQQVDLNLTVLVALLVLSFLGWCCVALNIQRSLALPVISLPSMVVLWYAANLSPAASIVFFVAIMCFTVGPSIDGVSASRQMLQRSVIPSHPPH